MVKIGTIQKFGLKAIADALDGSDVATARAELSQVVGAAAEVSGTVLKRVKREGECKLVIESRAGFPENIRKHQICAGTLCLSQTVKNETLK
jgi:hypothetical protein